jgi:hypothetical protein
LSSLRILIVSIATIALALAIAACGGGGGGGAQEVLDEATLKGVESGKLNLFGELGAPRTADGNIWFTLSGKFQSKKGEDLPELDLEATVKGLRDGERTHFNGGLTLLGDGEAYVAFDGTDYKVDPTSYGYVRSTLEESEEASACQEVVSDKKLSEFIEDPSEEGSADLGGASVTKISGEIDSEAAIDALNEMRQDALCGEQLEAVLGMQSLTELEESEGQAENPVEGARIELYVGSDHIVRRIVLQAPSIKAPASAIEKGSPEIVKLEFDFTLAGVNEPQKISAPKSAKPLSALFVKLGVNPIELLGVLQGGIGGAGLTSFLERLAEVGSTQ